MYKEKRGSKRRRTKAKKDIQGDVKKGGKTRHKAEQKNEKEKKKTRKGAGWLVVCTQRK